MAYQVKSVRYQDTSRKILLQNENGPCPLLAAANALLLRGVVTLTPECIRNGVASIDDVVNMLANRALTTSSDVDANQSIENSSSDGWTTVGGSSKNTPSTSTPGNSHHEYHLNEVLSLLPNLQHGMDVNPKFTSGPTGVEYTTNLAAFDLLGVELVHGWLLDPQDVETSSVVGSKSYNELIELVIIGNDASEALKKLETDIRDKEKILFECEICDKTDKNDFVPSKKTCPDENEISESDRRTDEQELQQTDADDALDSSTAGHEPTQPKQTLTSEEKNELQEEITKLREKMTRHSEQISISESINSFLNSSSHQLTYHGLHELHNHVADGSLQVFFRNNHFATLTKHEGVLYLLVTDLGYANVPEVVWEKLDAIDGDTEYANEFFTKPKPRTELKAADGPTIAPELLLAQRSQAESDYQLALAMSKGHDAPKLDEDEGKLMEAAKELSLKSYHGEKEAAVKASGGEGCKTDQIDSDREVALAYQLEQERSDHESEQLARQLQELEYARQRPLESRTPKRQTKTAPPAQKSTISSSGSGCIIS